MPEQTKPKKISLYAVRARGLYLRWLYYKHKQFTLAGLLDDDQPIALKQIYIPLRLGQDMVSEEVEEKELEQTGHEFSTWLKLQTDAEITANRLGIEPSHDSWPADFDKKHKVHHFAVQGLPGSGKSTLVQHLAADLANPELTSIKQDLPDCLPVPLILREYDLSKIQSFKELVDAHFEEARKWVEEELSEVFEAKYLQEYFTNGLGFFMLDGVDEVGNLDQRNRFFRWVWQSEWFAMAINYANYDLIGSNRFMVTGRPTGFEGLNEYTKVFRFLHVLPFNRSQIDTFVTRWYGLRARWVANKEKRIRSLNQAITEMPHLSVLARRPAFLTMMAFIHGTRGALPHTRAMLYEQITDAYISLLDQQRDLLGKDDYPLWPHKEKKDLLSVIAYKSHIGSDTAENRLIQWTREKMLAEIRETLENRRVFQIAIPADAENLTRYYLARTGLLQEPKPGYVQFGHLSFQEYLTALYLLNEGSGKGRKKVDYLKEKLLDKLDQPGWVEVAFLLLALEAERTRGQGALEILCNLDLGKEGARQLLAEVLCAEKEIPLEEKDRRFWLGALMAYSSRAYDYSVPQKLGNTEELKNRGKEFILHAVKHWQRGVSPYQALLVECPQQDEDCDLCWRNRVEEEFLKDPLDDQATAVLTFAALADWWSPETDAEVVKSMPQHDRLFENDPKDGVPYPSSLMTALTSVATWGSELSTCLLQRSLLAWVYLEQGISYWPNLMAFAQSPTGNNTQNCFKEWTIIDEFVARGGGARARGRVRARGLTRARGRALSLTLDRALDRALLLARVGTRALDRARGRALALTRAGGWALDLALALARGRALDLALDLALARALARARARLDLTLARALARALDRALDLDRNRNPGWEKSREVFDQKTSQFLIWLISYEQLQDFGVEPLATVAEARALRDKLADPDQVAAGFPEKERERRKQEWQWILDQDWSPIRHADAFLATNPTDDDLKTENVIRRYTDEFNQWADEAEKLIDEDKKGKNSSE